MPTTEPARLPDTLGELAWVYQTLAAQLGWTPRQVDELEIWEAARLIGVPDGQPTVLMARMVSLPSVDAEPTPDLTAGRNLSRTGAGGG